MKPVTNGSTAPSDKASNITLLNRNAEQHRAHVLRQLPKPILTLKQQSDLWLAERLEQLLARADDTLFDMATNSHNQKDQDAFFFALRQLRQQRVQLVNTFQQHLTSGYACLLEPDPLVGAVTDELSVIANDEMDEILAIEAALKRVGNTAQGQATCLMTRMESLCACDNDVSLLPLSAKKVCEAFKQAMAALELEINPRLVLFKYFEQQIVESLPELYTEMNRVLSERGILPALDAQSSSASAPLKKSQSHLIKDEGLLADVVTLDEEPALNPTDIASAEKADDVRDQLEQLTALASGGEQVDSEPVDSEQLADDVALAESNRQTLDLNAQQMQVLQAVRDHGLNATDTVQLLSLLKELQQTSSHAALTRQGGLLQLLGANKGALDCNERASPQVRRLEVVDGLFDALLTEQTLANPAKEMLARLQVPLARAAVAEEDFFQQENHSARQLINALAGASMAWRAGEQPLDKLQADPLYKKMESIVERAVETYDGDDAVFGNLLSEFQQFTLREKQRLAVLEKRMKDAEEGKAKSEQARIAVAEAIAEVCAGRDLRSIVHEVIHTAWHQVMFVAYVHQAADSSDWQASLKTLEHLVNATHDLRSFIECDRARRAAPGIISELKEGLVSVEFDAFKSENLMARLEAFFDNIEPASPEEIAQINVRAKEQITQSVANERGEGEAEHQPDVMPEPDPVVDDQYYRQAKALSRGTWLDYCDGPGEPVRCRLAALIEANNTYIFVDRAGKKVLQKSLLGLALALKSGELLIIDSSQLFDRALQQVILGLRKADIPEC